MRRSGGYLWRALFFLFLYVVAILVAGISSCILNSRLLSINSAYLSDNLPISAQTAAEGNSTVGVSCGSLLF